ncbi:class I adenylate cyclase [Orbaceae bacterium ESL0727]|nr:class I adenylate cyclase [Orbaceae bacterium ESL0727]
MQYNINNINDIHKIKKTLTDLAHLKREQTLVGMPVGFRSVFLLLPILFQYNHSGLPGYLDDDNVPHGIANYQPINPNPSHDSNLVKNNLVNDSSFKDSSFNDSLFNDNQANSEIDLLLTEKFHLTIASITSSLPNHQAEISAIYSMGSTGSIGQSVESDLDIWICIEQSLSEERKICLQKKCRLIEAWASEQNVKLTLFVVDVNRFIEKHHECLMGENCGSAQHMLLLEEFYRSANLIAGKHLLWFAVPQDLTVNNITYNAYNECVAALVNNGLINRDEWIDFGSLGGLSAEEYFGASLWQLYKSIDSPFKAVLKTLLLEAYSWLYPENRPIAYEMKTWIQQGNLNIHEEQTNHFDSYYMMLERITAYLIDINDWQRLALARACFYLKVDEKLSMPTTTPSWRRALLTKLVTKWGWQQPAIEKLDACHIWKIKQVREIHELLLHTMMTGYRKLLNFGRRNNLDAQVSPQDLAVLTRKLYAEFEVLPGKITTLKLNISNNLQEEALTFIHVQKDRINRAGWYVYNQQPKIETIIGHQYLEYSKYLVKLVGWCYFNGLIVDSTKLFFYDGDKKDNTKIKQLVKDLQHYFPIDVPAASEAALYGPCEIRHLAIMINLENDPTAQTSFADEINSTTTNSDPTNEPHLNDSVLNYGKKEISLIGSIDLLYRNSWNEIRVLHFNGSQCLFEAIKTLLNRMHKDADLPNSIEIFCYSKLLQTDIKQQIKELMDDCIELRLTTTQNNSTQVKPLRINGSSWYLFFERLGVSFHQFANSIDFYGAVSNNKVQGRALNMLDETNEMPTEIDSVACEGIIQFFFEDTHTGFDLYILNEHNQVEIYRNCNGNKYNMLKDINNFYALSDDRFSFAASSSINFNLPQFYQIIYNPKGQREILPLG